MLSNFLESTLSPVDYSFSLRRNQLWCNFLFLWLLLECKSYKTLNTRDRSMSVPRGKVLKCDQKDFSKGWYRFSGQAGSAMPTKCVAKHHCGTHAPGWMQGAHPTPAQGIVTRKVCYHWSKSCCHWSNNIRVRNCGGFYVYELDKTPVCHLRYCGNAGGKSSSTIQLSYKQRFSKELQHHHSRVTVFNDKANAPSTAFASSSENLTGNCFLFFMLLEIQVVVLTVSPKPSLLGCPISGVSSYSRVWLLLLVQLFICSTRMRVKAFSKQDGIFVCKGVWTCLECLIPDHQTCIRLGYTACYTCKT